MRERIARAAYEEFGLIRPRLELAMLVARVLPDLAGCRARTWSFRLAGVSIGPGTLLGGALTVAGPGDLRRHLAIGRRCWINAGCQFDITAPITVGDEVAIAQDVLIITQTHELGAGTRRAGRSRSGPVAIESGSWIGARAVILPGVTIGGGAVVAAGSVVREDVPCDTLVAGVPARLVRALA